MGLGVKSAQMEWSATVQSVKSGRADVMLGNMGWTPARAQALLITDAIYFPGTMVCMKVDKPFTTSFSVNDVKGHSIGTVNGFTIVPEMKKLPGVSEVKLYDNSDGCVRDVVAGVPLGLAVAGCTAVFLDSVAARWRRGAIAAKGLASAALVPVNDGEIRLPGKELLEKGRLRFEAGQEFVLTSMQ